MSKNPVVYGRSGFSLQPANMGEAMRMAEMLASVDKGGLLPAKSKLRK